MKKKILMLPCIAAVAIVTFVGKKTMESNAYEKNSIMMENVEALSAGGKGIVTHYTCEGTKNICHVINLITVIDGKLTEKK